MSGGERRSSPVVDLLELLWDLAVLNVLFLACCVPVVTGGGALAGLCYGAEKLRRQEGKPAANFFRGFRQNFRQGTAAWLAALAILAFLFLDLYLLIQNGAGGLYYLLLGLVFLWLMFTLVYLYPLMVRFENKLLHHVRNAFLLSVTHLWQSVCLTVLALAPALLWLFSTRLLLYTAVFWLALGFAAVAYASALVLQKVWPKSGDAEEQ